VLTDTRLDHAWIERHIPHKGGMCLLDRVASWDDRQIHCRAVSHRDNDHPLRRDGSLGAACGIEYAAQAMAVHGALLAPPDETPRVGYLVSVRGVRLHVLRLDDIDADLDITAACLTRSDNHLLYEFTVAAGGRILLEGRAAVVLDATALGATVPGQQ
jgi:predicted hotdog family 3-hydroxylacyl-ACP dehydratase